jgi:hypothetical protein
MANTDRPPKVESGRAWALHRLNQVLAERRRLRNQATATGTSTETRATGSLRAVEDQTTAPEPQLKTVGDGRGD